MQPIKALVKRLLPASILRPLLLPYHWVRGALANIINGLPARGMNVVMITGTNGKTTTSAFLGKIFEASGQKVGISTTAFFQIGDEYTQNDLNMTVTNPFKLQKLLKRMRKEGVDWVILETTSHSLHQYRVLGIPKKAAVMTNLTQDHLDYHGTMDRYAEAKGKMFKHKPPFIVLNRDDEWYNFYSDYQAGERQVAYGTDKLAEYRITKAKMLKHGSKLQFSLDGQRLDVDINLVGQFNAYNALAAATTAHVLGIDGESIKSGLSALENVPGRMETIENKRGLTLIVDYAHTPDALRKSLETLKAVSKGHLFAVYGATGDRDKEKRPEMGEIGATLADVTIITDEEPYTENPLRIREGLLQGAMATEKRGEVLEVGDRRGAIHKALQMAKKGDTVYITGMGHQSFRKVGDTKEPWDDREVVRELLEKL